MSSFYIDKDATIDMQIDFYKKYKIQIPFMKWQGISLLRISIQAYNRRDDVYKLLDALKTEFI